MSQTCLPAGTNAVAADLVDVEAANFDVAAAARIDATSLQALLGTILLWAVSIYVLVPRMAEFYAMIVVSVASLGLAVSAQRHDHTMTSHRTAWGFFLAAYAWWGRSSRSTAPTSRGTVASRTTSSCWGSPT